MTRTATHIACVSVSLCLVFAGLVLGEANPRAVYVNQTRLSEEEIQSLERAYRVRLQSGHFWYDRRSGLWGFQGGPTAGQLAPGLRLGGPLRANASNGHTGVFINGREIHDLELRYLQSLFGQVRRARYWLGADGRGGFEDGPAQFDLGMASQQLGNDWIRRTPGGTVGGSGGCSYYSHPNGSSVMTGNC